MDFYSYYKTTMRNLYDCDNDCYAPNPDELSIEEYQDTLLNCFPKIIFEFLSTPRKMIDPNDNFILTWELISDINLLEQIWNASEETCRIYRIIYEYLELKCNPYPFVMEEFFSNWTHYILTNEWPDKTSELEKKLKKAHEDIDLLEKTNNRYSSRLEEYKVLIEERYTTIKDAARALLIVTMDKNPLENEVNTITKRITRKISELTYIAGKQNRKYYSIDEITSFFQNDDEINLTNADVKNIIYKNSIPKSQIIKADKIKTT